MNKSESGASQDIRFGHNNHHDQRPSDSLSATRENFSAEQEKDCDSPHLVDSTIDNQMLSNSAMENGNSLNASSSTQAVAESAHISRLADAIKGLRSGDHLCWLYEDDDDYENIVQSFVRDGLSKNEKVVYCNYSNTPDKILHTVSAVVPDIGRLVQKGQFVICAAENWYFPDGVFNETSARKKLKEEISTALSEGYLGLRLTSEMNWALDGVPGASELIEYESKVNDAILGDCCICMCQYYQKGFELPMLLDVLATHPVVALGNKIYENMYYIPPQDLLARSRPAATLSHSLKKLRPLRSPDEVLEKRSHELVNAMDSLLMLESVLGSMSDGVVVTDENANIILVNRAGRHLMGFGDLQMPLAERATRYGYFLADGVTLHPVETLPIMRAIRGEVLDQYVMMIRNVAHPEGIWVSINARPLRDRFRGLNGGIVVIRDITEQKKAENEQQDLERKMQQTQKLESLGILAGGIAHDFNNMLAGIMGNVGLLLMQVPEDSTLRPKLEQIKLGARRSFELTNQLLAYSGRGNFEVASLELTTLVSEMSDLLRTAVSKKAELCLEFSPESLPIRADATQVRQVIMNLITNASDAVENDGGVVTVRTGMMQVDYSYLGQVYFANELEPGQYVFFEVEDTGVGMDAATQAKIFDPFFTTKFVGRGLGLAAVLGIVRAHRGALKLDSVVNSGTTFRVLFPVSDEEIFEESPVEPWTKVEGGGLALVVDDEESVRSVVAQMLEAFGYEVITAANGVEGVEKFRLHSDDISVVLMDMTMPDINGDEACEEILNINPQARVIMMSGYSEIDAAKRFSNFGPAGFLQKPYGPETLLRKVQEVCAA